MTLRTLVCALAVSSWLAMSGGAAAQDPPEPPPVEPFHASGFVDAYALVNFNTPNDDLPGCVAPCSGNALRAFDIRSHELALNLAELAIWIDPQPVGVRVDLDFGPTTDLVHAFDPATPEVVKHIEQAYGTAVFDVGRGLTLDVGKFVTHMGQEVIETRDNWNYSRSLLFTWAIPFYHFGLKLTYPFADTVSASLFVVNGWNNVVDLNDGKTLGLQVVLSPSDLFTAYVNYVGGPEQANSNTNFRHVLDLVLLLTPIERLQLGLNFDIGHETNAIPADPVAGTSAENAAWHGLALSGRYAANSWLALAARGEWYDDVDGFTTGTDQSLLELTLTVEARYHDTMIVRLEYRHDDSNEHVFLHETTQVRRYQDTVTLGTVFGF